METKQPTGAEDQLSSILDGLILSMGVYVDMVKENRSLEMRPYILDGLVVQFEAAGAAINVVRDQYAKARGDTTGER